MTSFGRTRRGDLSVDLDVAESRLVRHVLGEMLELLGGEDQPLDDGGSPDDPLAAALGIGTATSAPDDPALARLFPDGYTDDPDASADFRRYTEPGLRAAKRAAIYTVLATLDDSRGTLTPDEAESWLRALNDARLVLGERLGVTEDWDAVVESLSEDDSRLPAFWVYDRLTYLQESLVQAHWTGS